MNQPERVTPELRLRIMSVVQRLGWVPDGAARALATRRSATIGAIFPTLSHGDFARAIDAIHDELSKRGFTLLLACSEYKIDQEFEQARKMIERGVDGLILVGETHHPEMRTFLQHHKVPFINTFVYNPETHGTAIGPNNYKALFRLTSYLADLGHRRFGVIVQSTLNNDRAQARINGIRDALSERGIAVQPNHFIETKTGIAEGRTALKKILSRDSPPTALICCNALLSIGALLESQAMGIPVPKELSIVGYDDVEIMRELPVPITTVRVLGDEIGRRAARYLVAKLGEKAQDVSFECDTELILRASSGPAPKSVPKSRG